MSQRKGDIPLSEEEYAVLITSVETAFRSYINTNEKFTGTKTARIYRLLHKEIDRIAKIKISPTSLRNIMTGKHTQPFRSTILNALNNYIEVFNEQFESTGPVERQRIFWGVAQGLRAGAFIERIDGPFIEWEQLKHELETQVIRNIPRIIPVDSTAEKASFYGKEDWLVNIVDADKTVVGSVWIGGDPLQDWAQDGNVRVGKVESDSGYIVYQVYARYSDGSFRLIKAYNM